MANTEKVDTEPFYSVIEYVTEGKDVQQTLADAFVEIQEKWVAYYPGYRGARILASIDGTRLYNIVEWESETAFRNFEANSDTTGRAAAIAEAIRKVNGKAKPHMPEQPRYRLIGSAAPK